MINAKTLHPANLWRNHPRESGVMAVLALVSAAVIAGTAGSTFSLSDRAEAAVMPPPPAMEYRAVAPDEAVKINNQIPIAGPAGAARPFLGRTANAAAQGRALDCLTSAIYYEAGQESSDGQRAVAQVILNRVRHPAFPSSVCGVVYEGSTRQTGCQFTFTCDGSMARTPMNDPWNRARQVAAAALAGSVYANVGNATHYHAYYVVPYWASSLAKTAVVGAHLFYRWSGGWGLPGAFAQAYSGREADPRALKLAAMSIIRQPAAPQAPTVTMVAGAAVKVEPDGKRVRVLFTPQARAAVEKIVHKPYVERAGASDNLRWAMGDGAPAATEQAFGAKPAVADPSIKAN
ncbi:cell wall hydrolase [Sphingomonas sp.]|uniref:cell wall hydrolase n=1 Tax=Sphingomonas sp. TaxID=28214 RepID=UPI00286AE434|nr:cell wall hydrolase [Sphingomonas sp.]